MYNYIIKNNAERNNRLASALKGIDKMKKTAINKCPICGGTVSIAAYARVWLGLDEDGSLDLYTEAKDIIKDATSTLENRDSLWVKKREDGDFEISADV